MDQATHNKSFNRHFCQPQPLRTLAKSSAYILVIEKAVDGLLDGLFRRLLRGTLPAERDAYRRQIVVTVSQELTARLGAGFSGQALIRMARFVGWMPSAIGRLQGGFATQSSQILVTVSRALTPHQRGRFSCAKVTHMVDRREVGLVAGQA